MFGLMISLFISVSIVCGQVAQISSMVLHAVVAPISRLYLVILFSYSVVCRFIEPIFS